MRIGNIIAAFGIVLGFIGITMLPWYMPLIWDTNHARGSGWWMVIQTGVLKWPGLIFALTGGALYYGAKLLPRKYWKTMEDVHEEEIQRYMRSKKSKQDK